MPCLTQWIRHSGQDGCGGPVTRLPKVRPSEDQVIRMYITRPGWPLYGGNTSKYLHELRRSVAASHFELASRCE